MRQPGKISAENYIRFITLRLFEKKKKIQQQKRYRLCARKTNRNSIMTRARDTGLKTTTVNGKNTIKYTFTRFGDWKLFIFFWFRFLTSSKLRFSCALSGQFSLDWTRRKQSFHRTWMYKIVVRGKLSRQLFQIFFLHSTFASKSLCAVIICLSTLRLQTNI